MRSVQRAPAHARPRPQTPRCALPIALTLIVFALRCAQAQAARLAADAAMEAASAALSQSLAISAADGNELPPKAEYAASVGDLALVLGATLGVLALDKALHWVPWCLGVTFCAGTGMC